MFKYTLLVVYIIAQSLCANGIPLKCDSSTQVLYLGQCFSQQCIQDKLPRLTKFAVGDMFSYMTDLIAQDGQQNQYHVTISYPDILQDQIVSDPNCLDWRVYQTMGNEDNERKYTTLPGQKPLWPIANYTYDLNTSSAQFDFNVTQQDLVDRNCTRTEQATATMWDCYFEFAFMLKNETQISHFFNIVVIQNRSIGGNGTSNQQNQLATVNTVKKQTVFVMNCQEGDPKCQVTITIASSLLFCSDQFCSQTSDTPYQSLFVNQEFYMKHQIDSVNFKTGWTIDDVQIIYNSQNLKLVLNSVSLNLVKAAPGYNIYQLIVPIVSSNVLISATGVLNQLTSRRLLQPDSGQNIVFAQQNTGNVQMKGQPTEVSVTSTSIRSHFNSGSILCLGAILLITSYL